MEETLTLATIGTVALTEGIKFLYEQAGEVLKRWRERKETTTKESAPPVLHEEPALIKLPSVFEGQLVAPKIQFEAVERLEASLRTLRKEVSEYAEGIVPVNITNTTALHQIDALRQVLEAVYQQRLTFKGEQRPASGPVVDGQIDVETVLGYAAGVRTRHIHSGHVIGQAQATQGGPGSQIVGVDAGTIGEI